MAEAGRQTFEAVVDEAAGRIARISAEEGVARLVHVSAIGADPGSDSLYAAAKGRGEEAVRRAFPDAVLLRPSIVFGSDDSFFNRLGAMARFMPVLPLVGPETRFQPVYVKDVAEAAVAAVTTDASPGVYELGGPEVATFRELMRRLLAIIQRRRLLVTLPFWLARIQAWFLDLAPRLTRGIVGNGILTRDQVRLLAHDNVVSPHARGLSGPRRRADRHGRHPRDLPLRLPPARPVRRHHRQRQEPAGLILEQHPYLVAALLGVIEGLTEFIPVSSTGHILLAGHFLGFHSTGKAFEVLIQLGAILAILSVYAGRLLALARAVAHRPRRAPLPRRGPPRLPPRGRRRGGSARLHQDRPLRDPQLVAIMLILGGIVLLWVDRRPERPRYDDAMDFSLPMAFKVGLFQCLALVPGVSRSGATIVGALLLGASKRSAAEFSFFLSMPTMAGAFAYDLYKNRDVLTLDDAALIAIGFVCAFLAAVLVVSRLLDFVSRRGYAVFGWWRIAVGGAALLALLAGR